MVRDPTALLAGLILILGGCASVPGSPSPGLTSSPRITLRMPTAVPIQVIGNLTLVAVAINRHPGALFIVDTGSASTFITPGLAKRLDVSIPPNAPRRQITVLGGSKIEAPFVRLSTLQIGEALVEHAEVAIHEVNPQAPMVDGLLGGDLLHHFRITLDRKAQMMRLEPL